MSTVKQAIYTASQRLKSSGIESARLDASVLLAHVMGIKRENLLLEAEKRLTAQQYKNYDTLITRRAKSEPIAYIIGKKEFWSLDFAVTRDTLIPRPDSELLIEEALKIAKNMASERIRPLTLLNIEVLDIGTGTGCLLIALLKELRKARGLGVDISESALKVARKNARFHEIDNRAQFRKSRWHYNAKGTFDLIISNPPYIAKHDLNNLMKDILDYEPALALASGVDGMDSYRMISKNIKSKINKGGYVLCEVGKGQAKKVAKILQDAGLTLEGIKNDLAGIPRCVIAKNQ